MERGEWRRKLNFVILVIKSMSLYAIRLRKNRGETRNENLS